MRSLMLCTIAVLACGSGIDLDAERSALREADLAFAREVADRRADGWVSYFASDGVMFRSGGTVMGQDSIRAFMTPVFADQTFTLTWEPVMAHVSSSGDLGYTLGRYESGRIDADGDEVIHRGSYVTIWRKQADGRWKVALDIGSPDEP